MKLSPESEEALLECDDNRQGLSSPCLNRPFGRPLFQAAQVESKP